MSEPRASIKMTAEDREPIGVAGQRAETHRRLTRDYLLEACELTCKLKNSCLSRYYRIKINSLSRHEEVQHILKNSVKSTSCYKCGSRTTPQVKRIRPIRTTKNSFVEFCNRCRSNQSHNLSNRNHLLAKQCQPKKQPKPPRLSDSNNSTSTVALTDKNESKKRKPIKPIGKPQFSSRLKLTCLLKEE